MTIITAASAEELQDAITNAKAGDRIKLLPINYRGSFILPKFSGDEDSQVKIYGTRDPNTYESTHLYSSNEGDTAFLISGNNWNITALAIHDFNTVGILEGSENSLSSLDIFNCKNGFKVNGNKATISSCVFRGIAFGHGILGIEVKGDDCSIASNTIKDTDEGIIVSGQRPSLIRNTVTANNNSMIVHAGVRNGTFSSNVLKGLASLAGSDFSCNGNTIHSEFIISGSRNIGLSNKFQGGMKILAPGLNNYFRESVC